MTTIKQTYANQANAFWQAWQQNMAILTVLEDMEFLNYANKIIKNHFDGVIIEMEGKQLKDSTLCFSADGYVEHFAKISAIIDNPMAKEYRVRAFRDSDLSNFSIKLGDVELSSDELDFSLSVGQYLINIEIIIKKSPNNDNELKQLKTASYLILDHLLGEWDAVVKVGGVDFVETFSSNDHNVNYKNLSNKLNELWKNSFGRTDDYPVGEHEYIGFDYISDNNENDDWLFTQNLSADCLIGGKFAWCVRIISEYDSVEESQVAQSLEIELDNILGEQAIYALTAINLSQGQYISHYYCQEPDELLPIIKNVIAKILPSAKIDVNYDVKWNYYRL